MMSSANTFYSRLKLLLLFAYFDFGLVLCSLSVSEGIPSTYQSTRKHDYSSVYSIHANNGQPLLLSHEQSSRDSIEILLIDAITSIGTTSHKTYSHPTLDRKSRGTENHSLQSNDQHESALLNPAPHHHYFGQNTSIVTVHLLIRP